MNWAAVMFLLPAILLLLFIYGFPVIFNLAISFTDWTGIGWDMNFIGIHNYRDIFTKPSIRTVLSNNFAFLIGTLVLQNIFALILSTWLTEKFRGRNFFRSVIFMPMVMPVVAVAMIFGIILDPTGGPITAFARLLGWKWLAGLRFLGNPDLVMMTLIWINVWQWTGWNMVIYLAGHQAIPQEIYEASAIDGAANWKKFRYITLPLLAPAITTNVVLTTMGALAVFDLPHALTGGGPGNFSEVLTMTIVRNATITSNAGLAGALSIFLAVIILGVTFVQNLFLSRQEAAVRE